MAKDNVTPPYSNGNWTWCDVTNGLEFVSRDVKEVLQGGQAASGPQPTKKDAFANIHFKDTVDNLGQAQFRRNFQRRIKPSDPQIVTIQDIKDVALFTAERTDLTKEFVEFMHTKKMDEFLRCLIVYFQFYLQVWDNLMLRREEARRKLRQPIVTVLENVVRDNLADLRSMLARNYSYILRGLDETFKYYHMKGHNVSLSDKDRHLHECLLSMMPKIVWIALLRKNFSLIEVEVNRLFRSKIFNIMARLRQSSALDTNAEEDRVLRGKAFRVEKKLKHRSPAVQELIFTDHNYKMLAIGHLRVEPVEERIAYFEAAYTAPEELLFEIRVGVGILGLSKDYLNPILQPKEGMGKRIQIPPFRPPVLREDTECILTETLPKTPPLYKETEQARLARITQCNIWRRHVLGIKKPEIASSHLESASDEEGSSLNEDSSAEINVEDDN